MMRREVERLRLDTALLRAARDKDSSLLKELKERKRLLDLQLHEQSKVRTESSALVLSSQR